MEYKLIKSNSGLISKVSNLISITNKIIDENILIPYRKGDKWGFCTPNKNIVIDCVYKNVKLYKNNLAAVNFDGKWGYINNIGKVVIPFQYDFAFSFRNGFAEVILNNIAFKINIKNELTRIDFNVDSTLEDIGIELLGFFESHDEIFEDKNEKFKKLKTHPMSFWFELFVTDPFGEISSQKEIKFNLNFLNNEIIYPFCKDNRFGFKNKHHEIIIPIIYETGYDFKNKIALVKLNYSKGWGFINEKGTQYWED